MRFKTNTFYCLFFPFTIFFLVSALLSNIFPGDITPSTNKELILYFLSALAQSQATIFAIVVGLNSIAIQLISTTYSSKVTDILSDDSKYLWRLFGLSIFYDLILILTVPEIVPKVYYLPISIAFILAVFSYYKIVSYVFKRMNIFLDPSQIMKKIIEKRDEDTNLRIFDFIIGSINRHDFKLYKESLFNYHQNDILKISNDKEFIEIISDFIRIGEVTVLLKNDTSTALIFERICKIFHKLQDKETIMVYLSNNLDEISDFAECCARNKLENSTQSYIQALRNVFDEIPEDLLNSIIIQEILTSLYNIGRISADSKLEGATIEAINTINSVANKKIDEFTSFQMYTAIIEQLYVIGTISVENKLTTSIKKIQDVLLQIASINILSGDTSNAVFAIEMMSQISIKCDQDNLKICVSKGIDSYKNLKDLILNHRENIEELEYKKINQKINEEQDKLC